MANDAAKAAAADTPNTVRPHTQLQATVRHKMMPLLRIQRARSFKDPHEANQHRMRSWLQSCLERDATTLLMAVLTALYLVFVLLDVMLDEVLVVEERSCAEETHPVRVFLDAKSIFVARIDSECTMVRTRAPFVASP